MLPHWKFSRTRRICSIISYQIFELQKLMFVLVFLHTNVKKNSDIFNFHRTALFMTDMFLFRPFISAYSNFSNVIFDNICGPYRTDFASVERVVSKAIFAFFSLDVLSIILYIAHQVVWWSLNHLALFFWVVIFFKFKQVVPPSQLLLKWQTHAMSILTTKRAGFSILSADDRSFLSLSWGYAAQDDFSIIFFIW